MGLCFGGSISVNSLYVQELLLKKDRAVVLTLTGTIEGLSVARMCIYFLYITKYWQGWYIFGLVIQFLVIIGMMFLPESPEFYFSKGRYLEAKQVIL